MNLDTAKQLYAELTGKLAAGEVLDRQLEQAAAALEAHHHTRAGEAARGIVSFRGSPLEEEYLEQLADRDLARRLT